MTSRAKYKVSRTERFLFLSTSHSYFKGSCSDTRASLENSAYIFLPQDGDSFEILWFGIYIFQGSDSLLMP